MIAVVLFAALSYAVTQSGRGGGNIDREKDTLAQAVSEQCNASIEYAVSKLRLLSGCGLAEISYELADGSNVNPNAPASKICHVFDPDGAGATPCGAYLGVGDCVLEELALGEKCAAADIIYAGISGGNRIYTTAANQGMTTANDGSTSYATTGASSSSNGVSNTNALIGFAGAGAPYAAAYMCRSLGADWYLPALDELEVLYNNHAAIGGFNTDWESPESYFWSSTEVNSNYMWAYRFGAGSSYGEDKQWPLQVRCVRQ